MSRSPTCPFRPLLRAPARRKSGLTLRTALLALWMLPAASANPTGGQVVAGVADIRPDGRTVTVTQGTAQAIINWADFSIAPGETTRFVQPDALSAVLNRVTGGNPTAIHGTLEANGRVFVLNPNGVLVGPDGRVDTSAFLASTHRLDDKDFLQGGALRFAGAGEAGIINLGTIRAAGGDAVLLGRTVENRGTLTAPQGAVRLGAGDEILLAPAGDHRLVINAGPRLAARGVDQAGVIAAAQAELQAAGGNAYSLAVNHGGSITAIGVAHRDGRVLLTAADGTIALSGSVAATDASGNGGEILVGGDLQGGNAAVANAARVLVADTATLAADAAAPSGQGGRVIVWSQLGTQFLGNISARGGPAGGDGGFAEVSGQQALDYRGTADLRAPAGVTGTLLLDPSDITISAAANSPGIGLDSDGSGGSLYISSTAASNLGVASLQNQLALGNVTISTSSGHSGNGDITVLDPVAWTSGNRLTLLADRDIAVNANVTANAGSLVLVGRHATSAATATIEVGTLSVTPRFNGSTATFHGAVRAATLSLGPASGITTFGGVTATHTGNRLGHVEFTYAGGGANWNGDLNLFDGADGLTLDGLTGPHTGNITVRTVGHLTLHPNALFATSGTVALEAAGGDFISQLAGTNPFPNAARFLIYSRDPATIQRDILTGAKRYDATFATHAPGTISTTGGHFFYGIAPTLTFTAANQTKTYGAANPVFGFSFAGGLIDGDTAVAAYTGAPVFTSTGVNVGTHAITGAAGTLSSPLGYRFAFNPGTLTINPATLTIAANDATRSYGAANPAFTATYTGLVNGDTAAVVTGLAFSTSATPASGVGTYAITPVGGTASNYTIVGRTPGTLAITPAQLTIAAKNAERLVLQSNPPFGATFAGLVNGDTPAVVTGLDFTTPATRTSPVGDYPITPTGGQAANYTLTLVPGVLTVRPLSSNPAAKQDVVQEGLGAGQRPDTVLASGTQGGASPKIDLFAVNSTPSDTGNSTPANTSGSNNNNSLTITFVENPAPLTPQTDTYTDARNGYEQWWDVGAIEGQLRTQQQMLEQRGLSGPHDRFIQLLEGDSISTNARMVLRSAGYSDADIALLERHLHSEGAVNQIAADRALNAAERSALDRMLRDARLREQVTQATGPYGLVPAATPVLNDIIASISRDDIKDILMRKALLDYRNSPEGLRAVAEGRPLVLPVGLYPTQADIDLYYNGLGKDSITDGIIMPFLLERVLAVRQRDALTGISLSTGATVSAPPVTPAERALYNQVEAFIQMKLEQAAEAMLVGYLNEFTSEKLRVDQHEAERSQRSHGLHNLIDVNAEGQMRFGEYAADTASLLQSAFGGPDGSTLATDSLAVAAGVSGVVTAAGTAGVTGSKTALQGIMPFFKGISSARVLGGPIAAILGTALGAIFETAAELDWSGDPSEAIVRCLEEVRRNPVSLAEILSTEGGEAIVWSAVASMVGGAGDAGFQAAPRTPYVEIPPDS